MEPKSVDFSVIKQKIIKTDEVLQMYLETEKKLKKAQLANKNMKVQATTSLNRLRLENERYTFTIESTKTKCNDLQSENQQLMEQKSLLEKKYSSLLVDSQSTILELQNDLKMIKDLNASADKLSVSPKRKTVQESNSSKKYKELEIRLKKVQENEQKLKEDNERLLLDKKQITDEITKTKIDHSRMIASLNIEKNKLECEFKQLRSQIDYEKHQHNVMRDKDYEISKLKAEVLALRELKEQIKHLQEQNKKLNSDLLCKDVALYKAKEKLQAIHNVHTLHAETQTARESEVEPSKCSCFQKESLFENKIMVCSITQTELITEDSDPNLHKAKEKILAIQNVHTVHAETQTAQKPEERTSKCSCIKNKPGYSDSNLHKAKEKIHTIQKVHTLHAETQTSPDLQREPANCSCFHKEPLSANKTTCSFTQTETSKTDSVSKFDALDKDDVIDNIFKEMIFFPQMLSPIRNSSQDEIIIDQLPKFSPSIPAIMITPSTPLEKNMPLFAAIPANMESSGIIPTVETANQKIVNIPLAEKKLTSGIFENDNIEVLDLRKCVNLVSTENNIADSSEGDSGLIQNNHDRIDTSDMNTHRKNVVSEKDVTEQKKSERGRCNDSIQNGDEKNYVPEEVVLKTSKHECDNKLIQNRDDRIETLNLNTNENIIVPQKVASDLKKERYNNLIQNEDENNLVPGEVATELNTSKHECDNESIQNRDHRIDTPDLNSSGNNYVPEEVEQKKHEYNNILSIEQTKECDNKLIQNRDDRIDTLNLNNNENIIVPPKMASDLKKFEHERYNNLIQNEDENNLVSEKVATELNTSKHECDNEHIQNLNIDENIIVPQKVVSDLKKFEHERYNKEGDGKNLVPEEVATELRTSKNECDNDSIQNRDHRIDTPDLNTSGNSYVPEEVEQKKHEYNNILSIEQTKESEKAKSVIEKPLRKKRFRPSTSNSIFIKKQVAMKHVNKKGLIKKRFMLRKLKTQDSVLRALQVLKQSKINFTISNESTLPLLLHEHDWLNKHCHTSSNYVPPPVPKVPSTKADKRLVEKLRCSSSCCNKMFMLLSGKPRNPNLHGFFKVKKEIESPLYSRMDTTTHDQPENPLKWLNESLKKEITPENLLDTLAELVSQKLRDNKNTKRKRSSPSENSDFFSETETEIERLFPDPKNTLEINKMLLKKAKYDLEMESTSVTSLEENDMNNVNSQTEEKFDEDSSLSKQMSQEPQANVPSMPLVNSPVSDLHIILRTPEKNSQDIEDVDSCDSFKFSIHPDILSPLSTSTTTESPKPKIIEATEFPSSIENTPGQRDISRKIEFKSPSCSEKTKFSSPFSPTKIESILGEEISTTGYTNSFSVVRSPQSQNAVSSNESVPDKHIHHYTCTEKNATHNNQYGNSSTKNFVDGICKLENSNICLVTMSEDKLKSELVDCKRYMLDQSSSFQSSFDMTETKKKQQIKRCLRTNVNVTPNSGTCINESEMTSSENELNYEVIDCEKNRLDQSSSFKSSFDVEQIENKQIKRSLVNNGEMTPNSNTCVNKIEMRISEDELSYEVVDCKKNMLDFSVSSKSSFDVDGIGNEQKIKRSSATNIEVTPNSDTCISKFLTNESEMSEEVGKFINNFDLNASFRDNTTPLKRPILPNIGRDLFSTQAISPIGEKSTKITTDIIDLLASPSISEESADCTKLPETIGSPNIRSYKQETYMSLGMEFSDEDDDYEENELSNVRYSPANNRDIEFDHEIKCDGRRTGELNCPKSPQPTDVQLFDNKDIKIICLETEHRPLIDISESDNQLDFPQSPEHSDAQLLVNEDIKIIPLERTTVEKKIEEYNSPSLWQRSKNVKSDQLINLTSQIDISPSHSTVDAIKGEEAWKEPHPKTIVGQDVDLRDDISESDSQLDFPKSPEHSDAQLFVNEDIKIIPLERTTHVEKDNEDNTPSLLKHFKTVKSDQLLVGQDVDLRDDISESDSQLDFPKSPEHSDAQLSVNEDIKIIPLERTTDVEDNENNTPSLLQHFKTVKSDQLLNLNSQIEIHPSLSTVDATKGKEDWKEPHPKTSIIGQYEDLRDDNSESDSQLNFPQSPEHSDAQSFVNEDIQIMPLERTTDLKKDNEEDNTPSLLQCSKTVKSDQLLNVDLRDDIYESDNQLDFPKSPEHSQLFVNENIKIIPLERTTDVEKGNEEDNTPSLLQHFKTVKSNQLQNITSQIEIHPSLSTVDTKKCKEDWKEPHSNTSIIRQDVNLRDDISESNQLDFPKSPEHSQLFVNEDIKIIPLERTTDVKKQIEEDNTPSLLKCSKTVKSDQLLNLISQIEIHPSLSTVDEIKGNENWKGPHPNTIGQDVDLRDYISESDNQLDFPKSPEHSDAQLFVNENLKIIPIERSTNVEKEIEEYNSPSLLQRSKTVKSNQHPDLTSHIEKRPSFSSVNALNGKEDGKALHPDTSIIGQDIDLGNDISEPDNQLEIPQLPKVLNGQFFISEDVTLIPLQRGTYVTKRNEDSSPPPLRQNSKNGPSMIDHKEIQGPLPTDKAIKTFDPEGDFNKIVDSPKFPQTSHRVEVENYTPLELLNSVVGEEKNEISEPVKRKRGRPRKQKIETETSAEFDVEHSNRKLETVIQEKRELRSQTPKTLVSSKKIEAMKSRRKSTRLTGTLANSNEQKSTENVDINTMVSEVKKTLKPPPKRCRENKQALSKEFIDSDVSDSESDAQNRTKKICIETKISEDLVPTEHFVDNTVISCNDGSGITKRLPSKSPKKSPSNKRPKKPMTKMKSNVLRQMNLKRKMFQTEAPSFTARSIESNCDVKINATDRLNVEIKDKVNKIGTNIDLSEDTTPTKNKITVVQNFLIPPGDSNPVDLLKFNSPPNLISEPSSSQNSLGPTETEIIPMKRKSKRKGTSLHNPCDILSQIIGQMDKNRPEITVKPKLVNKDVPAGTQEKQWRTKLLDIAEIVHNKDAQTQDLYGRLSSHVNATGLLKRGSQLKGKMKLMVGKLVNIPDEDDIPRPIILEFKRFKLGDIIDSIIHEVAKDFRDKPIDKYYPAPLMTRTQRLYLNLLVSLENEVTDNVLEMFLSRTQQYILRIGCGINAAIPLTRLFLAICRLKADINRMRTFCCEAFFYVGNLAVPILFTVLTSWIEVIPMAADVENYPIANVLVQLVHLKNFYLSGYNLIPLRCLLHQYHGYPKERRNCDEVFEEVFHQYLRNPTPTSNFAIRLFCRNKENKWVYKKINEFFKPLIYKIPMENVNFKATVILLLGKICKQFKPKDEHDSVCLVELNRFFLGLIEDDMPDLVRKSVSWSINGLPKKKTKNPEQNPKQNPEQNPKQNPEQNPKQNPEQNSKQNPKGDSANHSENPT